MSNNVCIIVNSCDKYEDAWEPFFFLLKKYWPECSKYDILLNTETKEYHCDFLNVKTLCSGNESTWCKRLKNALEKTDSEIVLLFIEDFFLQADVNNETFEKALNYISDNKDVGFLGLKYTPDRNFVDKKYVPTETYFSRDLLETDYRITAMSVLWRKSFLLDILDEKEDAWEFEINCSKRSKTYDYRILEINNINGVCPPVFCYEDKIKYGYGITQGQWLPKNKELFEKHDLKVNLGNLGINYRLYEKANGIERLELRGLSFVDKLYEIKKFLLRKLKRVMELKRD